MLLLAPLDHVTPFSPARRYTVQQKYLQNPTKTRRLQIWLFVVVTAHLPRRAGQAAQADQLAQLPVVPSSLPVALHRPALYFFKLCKLFAP